MSGLDDAIKALVETVLGVREDTQDDYALCGPSGGGS